MPLREEILDTRTVYEGDLLRVHRDRVRAAGETSVREWVEHPGASAVVARFADGDVMLVRQYRHPTRREYLEVPAGRIDPGELPADAARRELREEVGLASDDWTPLGETHPAIGYADEVIHLFLAEDVRTEGDDPDDGEQVIPVRMPFAEALAMARAGRLPDAKTVVALLRAEAVLAGRR